MVDESLILKKKNKKTGTPKPVRVAKSKMALAGGSCHVVTEKVRPGRHHHATTMSF